MYHTTIQCDKLAFCTITLHKSSSTMNCHRPPMLHAFHRLIFLRLTNLFVGNGVWPVLFGSIFLSVMPWLLGSHLQNDGRTLLLCVIYSAKIVAKVFPKLIRRCRNNWVAKVWAIKLFVSHIYQPCFA